MLLFVWRRIGDVAYPSPRPRSALAAWLADRDQLDDDLDDRFDDRSDDRFARDPLGDPGIAEPVAADEQLADWERAAADPTAPMAASDLDLELDQALDQALAGVARVGVRGRPRRPPG